MTTKRTALSPQQTAASSDPFSAALTALVCGAVAILLTPAAAGILAFAAAAVWPGQQVWFWRRSRRWYAAAALGAVAVVLVALWEAQAAVEHWPEDLSGLLDWWPWLLVNLGLSLLLVPAGWLLARHHIAAQVSQRRLSDAEVQDRIIEARHSAAQEDTARAAGHLCAPHQAANRQAFGRLVAYGVRTLPERLTRSRVAVAGWEQGQFVTLPPKPGAVRAVVLAESGAGKTVLLTGLALAALASGWRVVVIDGKGQESDVLEMLEAARAAGYQARRANGVQVLGLDVLEAHTILAAQWQDTGSAGADYYRGRTRKAVWAAMQTRPQTIAALREALAVPGKAGAPQEVLDVLTAKAENGQSVGQAAADAVATSWGELGERIGGGRDLLDFSALKMGLTVLPVRPRNGAERLLGIAGLLAYGQHLDRVQRGEKAAPLLLIVDEFAQLVQEGIDPAAEATSLMETARSAGLGLVLAAQSTAGLSSDAGMRERLLTSGAALLVGRMKAPEEVAGLMGTTTRLEAAGRADGSELTSGRTQHAYRVAPDRIRTSPTGCYWLVQAGAIAEFVTLLPEQAQ